MTISSETTTLAPGSRLVLVVPGLGPGGTERVVTTMANWWTAVGHHVTIVTLDRSSTAPFFHLAPGIVLMRLGLVQESRGPISAAFTNLGRVRALRRTLAQLPGHIVSLICTTNVLTLLATIGSGRPVVACERSDPTATPLPRVWRWLRNVTYRRASSIVVQTENVGDAMRRTYGSLVDVIPNPVAAPPRDTADLPIREAWILAAGRFTHEKGFDLLLHAFSAIAPTHPGWRLRIAGDGPLRDEWQGLAKTLGIADRVEWLGTRRDLPTLFARCGVFVLSSRFEGFPNVLCEAMAAGAPVVAFDCPSGPADIIRHHVDGLLVAREDAEQLSAALLSLVSDRALRAALGANARGITQRFSTGDVMRRWEAVLLKPS